LIFKRKLIILKVRIKSSHLILKSNQIISKLKLTLFNKKLLWSLIITGKIPAVLSIVPKSILKTWRLYWLIKEWMIMFQTKISFHLSKQWKNQKLVQIKDKKSNLKESSFKIANLYKLLIKSKKIIKMTKHTILWWIQHNLHQQILVRNN